MHGYNAYTYTLFLKEQKWTGFLYSNRTLIHSKHIHLYQRERKIGMLTEWVKVVTELRFSSELPGSQDKMRNTIVAQLSYQKGRSMAGPQRRHSISEHWMLNKFSHTELHKGLPLALSIPCSRFYNTIRSKFHEIITCWNDFFLNEGVTLQLSKPIRWGCQGNVVWSAVRYEIIYQKQVFAEHPICYVHEIFSSSQHMHY